MKYVLPSGPLSIGGVIDSAVQLYRTSFRRCWVLAFIIGLLVAALQIAMISSFPAVKARDFASAMRAFAALASPRILAADLLIMLLSLICYGAMLVQQFAIARGNESLSVGRSFGASLTRLPGLIVASIASLLATAVGVIALIVPGIYVWGRLQLWMPAMFADDAGAFGSLGVSWRLTRGNWWRGTTIFTMGVVIAIVFSFAIGIVGGAAAALAPGSLTERAIIAQMFSLVAHTILYPITPALWIAMYHDFKLRREGGDLIERVGALSNA